MRGRAFLAGVVLASAPALAQTDASPAAQPSAPQSSPTSPDTSITPPATAPATGTTTDAGTGGGTGGGTEGNTGGEGARTVYEAAYFQSFGPSTALQIVARVPGFTLDIGDQGVRGFSGAAGNVVINGQRPSAKADTLDTILARIPAARVLRVEVGRGDLFGSEFAGKAQVLNLVLTSAGGITGTVQAGARRAFTSGVYPQGSASALVTRGRSTFNVAAGIDNYTTPEEGTDTVTDLATGRVVEFRRKTNRISGPAGYVSASWAHDAGVNRTAHVNGRFALSRFTVRQVSEVFPVDDLPRDDRLRQVERHREFELGGDVTRPLLGGAVKFVALATRRNRFDTQLQLLRLTDATVLGGFEQIARITSEETVARLVWNRTNLGGWSVELGGEGVLNRLRSNVNLYALDENQIGSRIDLPVDQAVVTEYRGETFVNAGRALTKRLRLDLGLTYEASRLTVTGNAQARRKLQFLKPKATLDWNAEGGLHVQLSAARTVAQLNFDDFISSAELTNNRINGGNAQLLPQRAYEVRLVAEKPILGDGSAKIEFGYDAISLLQDRVPTPEGFDAPGNLGNARRGFVRATLDTPLKSIGLTGTRVIGHATITGTQVRDPYTLRTRPFSGERAAYWDIELRHDSAKFALSLQLNGDANATAFRLNELDSGSDDGVYAQIYADYRPNKRTTVTLGIDNAANTPSARTRLFFDPDRRTPLPYLREDRKRNRHLLPYLTFKYSFG